MDWPVSGAATVADRNLGNLVVGGDSYYVESLVASNIYWTPLPAFYPTAIGPGALANGGIIVVYGGSDGMVSQNATYGYSPSGDGTQILAPMSVARADFGYAPDANGLGYAIGGIDDSGNAVSTAERYDPDVNAWAGIASLPQARFHFPAVFGGGNYIYIFGGLTNTAASTETATVLRYSVSANTWSTLASMPIATAGSGATLAPDGNIYVAGGNSGGVPTTAVQVYNPALNTWSISTPLPEPLTSAAMGVDSLGRLVFMGGSDTNGFDVGDVWRSQRLGVPDVAPAITQYPGSNANYATLYSSSITATGNPQPTYVLFSGPPEMQVDLFSGAIDWTPTATEIGTNIVTIRATNYAGFADWTFTINVNPPPPTVPTNVTQIGATDTSVTLGWDPESPLAGPVSFNVYERHVVYQPKGGSRAYYTLVSSGIPAPQATISGLAVGSTHTYAVNAYTTLYSTANSRNVAARTTSPQSPTNVRVTALTSTSLSLAWDPSPGPEQNPYYSPVTSYAIGQYIPQAGGGPVNPIVTGITGTSGTVTGLHSGFVADWTVKAYDAQGYGSLPYYSIVVVTIPVPAAVTSANATVLVNGAFQFTATGAPNQTAIVETTSNLDDPGSWVFLDSFLATNTVFTITDTNGTGSAARFYRVTQP